MIIINDFIWQRFAYQNQALKFIIFYRSQTTRSIENGITFHEDVPSRLSYVVQKPDIPCKLKSVEI